jgi:integrase
VRPEGGSEPPWRWPIDPAAYDHAPALTAREAAALATLGEDVRGWRRPTRAARAEWQQLDRLLRPLADACAVLTVGTRRQRGCANAAVAAVLRTCRQEGTAFWGWPARTWVRVLGPTQAAFRAAHPRWVDRQVRHYLIGLPYVLRCFTDLRRLGNYKRVALAAKIFGPERVQQAVERLDGVLRGWGYQDPKAGRAFPRILCEALLLNGSPRLADLSVPFLDALRTHATAESHAGLFQVQRALAALGLVAPPVPAPLPPRPVPGVDPAWAAWVERWAATTPVAPATRRHVRLCVLTAGRWLAAAHATVREPAAWTRELCAAYVAAVDRMHVGEYSQQHAAIQARLGQPLRPRSKAAYLGTMRQFFRDCQEWGWIPRRFDPGRALATPRAVKALIGPMPRVIADTVWAKLLWAGVHLDLPDLRMDRRGRSCYPLAMVRALALTWLFSGLRSDEIARLRVGCVRWQAPVGGEDSGAADPVCLLDIPVHKTGTAFTKPVDPLLGRALETWEAVRPVQPPLPDHRTGERVALLFCYRAKRVARAYLNLTLIPALCRKAGIPRADARGPITSHRARSTIASQLYNAKEPMTLFELQAWLGHRSPQSTQHYTQITPTRLTQAYADAGYFARNLRSIAVLIDREAIQSGAAAAGTPWQYFDSGHGYCSYSFFEQCPHRMACARCDFYLPKASTKAQLLEAKAHLQRMLTTIPLTDDERAAVDDGADAVERLLSRLADTPTPAGPTPRELAQDPDARSRPMLAPPTPCRTTAPCMRKKLDT